MKTFLKAFNKAVEHNSKNDKKKSFQITYKKMNGRTVKRKIDPQNIRGNMVIAFDHKRGAIRSFKLDRLKAMEQVLIKPKKVGPVMEKSPITLTKTAFWNGFEKSAGVMDALKRGVKKRLIHGARIMKRVDNRVTDTVNHAITPGENTNEIAKRFFKARALPKKIGEIDSAYNTIQKTYGKL